MSASSRGDRPLANTYWVEPGRFAAGEYPRARSSDDAAGRLRTLLQAGVDCFHHRGSGVRRYSPTLKTRLARVEFHCCNYRAMYSPPPWFAEDAATDSISASRAWAKEADVPDPLRSVDAYRRPDLVAGALDRRYRRGWMLGQPRTFTYPKPSGGRRVMTVFDPIAEIAYRQMVGRVRAVDSLLSDGVFSTRLEVSGRSWRARPWRAARREYQHALQALRADDYEGEAHFDVEDHYGTVSTDLVRTVLNSDAAPAGAVDEVTGALDMLQDLPGSPQGLPVGPEGSSLLGTVALVPTDRALLRHHHTFLRWTDDYVVFLPSEDAFDAVVGLADEQLGRNGQKLNQTKVEWVELGNDGEVLASAFDGGGRLATDPLRALELNAELREPRGLTSALGLLRSRTDPRAIAVLEANPWMYHTFPKQVARYLLAVGSHVNEWDWVLGAILAETHAGNAAAQLHLASVLPRSVISRDVGASIFDMANNLRRSKFSPLANQLFAVAGRGRERSSVRRRRALEMADEMAELNAKRGLLTAFQDGGIDRRCRAGLLHLMRTDPDIEMTVDFVLSA